MFGHGPEFFPMLILFGFGFMIWRASRGRSRHHHGRHQHGWHGPPPVRPSGAPPVPPAAGGPWAEAGWAQSWAEPEPPRSPGGAGTGVAVPEWARADTDPPAAATPAPADPGLTEVSGEDPLLAEARRLSDPLQTEPYLFETAPSQASVALEVPPPRRHWGRRLVIAVVLVALGFVALVGALGPDEDGFVLASAVLVVIGGAMVVGGMRGRGRWLAFPGLAVLALLSIGSTVSITIEGGVGEVLIQPDSVSELEDSYNLGLGKLTIDLTSVTDFPSGRTVDIDADLGAGEMIVIVPAGVTVGVDATAGAGEVDAFGRMSSGIGDVELDFVEPGAADGGRVNLDLHVGFGAINVERGDAERPPRPERPEVPEVPEVPEAPEAPEAPAGGG
jgi:predicted membrane protein